MTIIKNIKRNIFRWLQSLLLLFLLFSFANIATAQKLFTNPEIEAKATLDTNVILIGDQTQIHLQLITPNNQTVQWPFIIDTLSKYIEVINFSKIDTLSIEKEGYIKLIQTITISSFDSGYHSIPPFQFIYDKQLSPIQSNALLVEVKNIKIDLSAEIKDIKPIIEEPWTFFEILPFLLLFIGFFLLIAFGIYFYQRYKQNKPLFSFPKKPKIPAHIIALQKLDILKEQKSWQKGNSKEFYSELTNIIREYMESNMHFAALEMVSDDILLELGKHKLEQTLLEQTTSILRTADLVKFAKVEPLADENNKALKWGYSYIELTKPKEQTSENKINSKTDVEPSKSLNI